MSDERRFLSNGQPVGDDESHKELRPDGMQKDYVVLSEEERAKGFVRPVRRSYWHVGIAGPKHPTRPLTAQERNDYQGLGYVVFEQYPEGDVKTGRYWTQDQLDKVGKGCQSMTTMGQALAETYARSPRFYGGTFCAYCREHYPVGEHGEFTWEDGSRVGT